MNKYFYNTKILVRTVNTTTITTKNKDIIEIVFNIR